MQVAADGLLLCPEAILQGLQLQGRTSPSWCLAVIGATRSPIDKHHIAIVLFVKPVLWYPPYPAMKHLLRIQIFLKPYFWQILATLLLLLVLTGLSLVVPRIIRSVIDEGLAHGETGYLVRSALLLFGLGLLSAVLNLGNRYWSEWIAARVGYDLRNRMYDHIQYLPFTYHDHAQSGQLISRCIEDVRSIERFAGGAVTDLIRFVLLSVGIITIMILDNARLAFIALLGPRSANCSLP